MLKTLRVAFILLFFGIGFSGFSYSLWSCMRAYQATSWPSVPGVIISDNCRDGPDRTAFRQTKYRYVVNSSDYVNDRDQFGLRISSNECFAEFQSGQDIVVFYNPAKPTDSALKPGVCRQGIFGSLIGLAFMLFSVIAFRRDRATANRVTLA